VSRAADRAAARREARVRRAELRLFRAARAYAAKFDRNSGAPLLRAPVTSDTPEVPSVVVLLAELEAAALHYADVAPALRRGLRRRQRS
jgi:hypothetical protein